MQHKAKLDALVAGKSGDDLIKVLLDNFAAFKPGADSRLNANTPVIHRSAPTCTSCGVVAWRSGENGNRLCSACGMAVYSPGLGIGRAEDLGLVRPITHLYKRITRFREVLRQLQGLGAGKIAPVVYDRLRHAMTVYGTTRVTPAFVYSILKSSGLGQHCEHKVRLAAELDPSFRPPVFERSLVRAMEKMFLRCDRAWPEVQRQAYVCFGWKRLNFPSYTMLTLNFLLKLGETKLANYVRGFILKSSELSQKQEVFWVLFCYNLKWPATRFFGSALVPALNDIIFQKCRRKQKREPLSPALQRKRPRRKLPFPLPNPKIAQPTPNRLFLTTNMLKRKKVKSKSTKTMPHFLLPPPMMATSLATERSCMIHPRMC
jgi:hypothetical protein